MTNVYTSTGELRRRRILSSDQNHDDSSAVDDLLEENAKLRKLVVELSRLAIKNVADRE